jgi:sRNA-binding carbon storage regulator CsrA
VTAERGRVTVKRREGESILVILEDGREIFIEVGAVRLKQISITVDAERTISIQRVRR